MAVYLGSNPVSVYNGGQPIIVESGQYAWERYEVAPDPCLSFVGNEEFTLKTNNTAINWDGILEYSTDAITWSTWNGTEISSSGNKLYLRGTGNSKITDYITNESPGARAFVFTGTDTLRISCEGNIEYLLDYETMRKQEKHEEKVGKQLDVHSEWTVNDNCYVMYINQKEQGLPIYFGNEYFMEDTDPKMMPVEGVISAKGIESIRVNNLYTFKKENRLIELINFDICVETVANKYGEILSDAKFVYPFCTTTRSFIFPLSISFCIASSNLLKLLSCVPSVTSIISRSNLHK